jgi:D-alanyl-D-alanine carboxypeptidase
MNKYDKYYGCENPEAISYLEFGSINIVKGDKKIWNYWQDQTAYDLYMFARYSRDLFSFRKFFDEREKTVEKLNEYVKNAAHNKLLDYIFKYAGMLAISKNGGCVKVEVHYMAG